MSNNGLNPWQQFVVGGIARVATCTFTSPLHVVRIIAQVGSKQHNGFIGTVENVFLEDGLKGFWKGNSVEFLRAFPHVVIRSTALKALREMLTDPITGRRSVRNSLIAGTTADVITVACMYPLNVVQTRLIVQVNGEAKYKGIIDAFRVIFKEEGFLAFYKGLIPTILEATFCIGLRFITFKILAYTYGLPDNKLDEFLRDCVLSAISQIILFPLDTISKKMQALTSEFTGLWDCICKTVKQNGFFGLWDGLPAKLASIAPYAAIMNFISDICRNYFLYRNG